MITKIRKIGNSTGVLLSKNLIEQCDIKDEVKISVKNNAIVIERLRKQPRIGWREQFIKAGSFKNTENLMGDFQNDFDKEEWTWK